MRFRRNPGVVRPVDAAELHQLLADHGRGDQFWWDATHRLVLPRGQGTLVYVDYRARGYDREALSALASETALAMGRGALQPLEWRGQTVPAAAGYVLPLDPPVQEDFPDAAAFSQASDTYVDRVYEFAESLAKAQEQWGSVGPGHAELRAALERTIRVVSQDSEGWGAQLGRDYHGLWWYRPLGGPLEGSWVGPWYNEHEMRFDLSEEMQSAPAKAGAGRVLVGISALVLKPPSSGKPGRPATPPRIIAVVQEPGSGLVDILFGGETVGTGYFGGAMGACQRTHTAHGVTERGTGLGTALYTALAAVAYQRFSAPCIASAPDDRGFGGRSPLADKWWGRAEALGIAHPTSLCDGCVAADLRTFIERGLVLWLREPGKYEGLLVEAREQYLEAFLAAEPHPASIPLIDELLSAVAADEVMDQWRAVWRPQAAVAATPNRRRARAARGRPAFVTPELEAHVEALYADLDGL